MGSLMKGFRFILGTVLVSNYMDDEVNIDLARSLGYIAESEKLSPLELRGRFPKYRFIPAQGGEWVDYEGALTADDMFDFIMKETTKPKPGQLEKFNQLALEFIQAEDRKTVLRRAEAAHDAAHDDAKPHAAYYLKVMNRILEKDSNWHTQEHNRLTDMLKTAKLTPEKKTAILENVNRLRSFVSPRVEL